MDLHIVHLIFKTFYLVSSEISQHTVQSLGAFTETVRRVITLGVLSGRILLVYATILKFTYTLFKLYVLYNALQLTSQTGANFLLPSIHIYLSVGAFYILTYLLKNLRTIISITQP